jgi:hypothetical protein
MTILIISTLIFNSLEAPPASNQRLGIDLITSFEALKLTPRYTLEPFAGKQIFARIEASCFYQIQLFKKVDIGAKSGFASFFHFTNFYKYYNLGLSDSYLWMSCNPYRNIAGFCIITIPTGNYVKSLGQGIFEVKAGLQKQKIYHDNNLSVGFKWKTTNPDRVKQGDGIFAEFGNENLALAFDFNFPDKSSLFDLHDSKSFSINLQVALKTFRQLYTMVPKLFFGQTIYGRDTEMKTYLKAEFVRSN